MACYCWDCPSAQGECQLSLVKTGVLDNVGIFSGVLLPEEEGVWVGFKPALSGCLSAPQGWEDSRLEVECKYLERGNPEETWLPFLCGSPGHSQVAELSEAAGGEVEQPGSRPMW